MTFYLKRNYNLITIKNNVCIVLSFNSNKNKYKNKSITTNIQRTNSSKIEHKYDFFFTPRDYLINVESVDVSEDIDVKLDLVRSYPDLNDFFESYSEADQNYKDFKRWDADLYSQCHGDCFEERVRYDKSVETRLLNRQVYKQKILLENGDVLEVPVHARAYTIWPDVRQIVLRKEGNVHIHTFYVYVRWSMLIDSLWLDKYLSKKKNVSIEEKLEYLLDRVYFNTSYNLGNVNRLPAKKRRAFLLVKLDLIINKIKQCEPSTRVSLPEQEEILLRLLLNLSLSNSINSLIKEGISKEDFLDLILSDKELIHFSKVHAFFKVLKAENLLQKTNQFKDSWTVILENEFNNVLLKSISLDKVYKSPFECSHRMNYIYHKSRCSFLKGGKTIYVPEEDSE